MKRSWQFWIDRGGTFTDIVAVRPDGSLQTRKLLSDSPEHYRDAAAEGIARSIDEWRLTGNESAPVTALKMGTTVATNALLERRGTPTALIVTQGYGDSVSIAYQNRPDIFALDIRKPVPIYRRVVEIDERVDADGEVLRAIDEEAVRESIQACIDDGINSVAICLMHGYRFPAHELRIGGIARELGMAHVSLSHDVEPLIRFVGRAETTLADAYLTPVLEHYIGQLQAELAEIAKPGRVMFMQSNGGLVEARFFRGKNSVLSGPAAGVVGMAESARKAGHSRLLGFDMGGTSTDVSLFDGEFERSNDSEIAGVRLRSPMMRIHTIAAGGSSVLHYGDHRFQVGPDSAGAHPGPVCYRRGGPLALTDANVLLGKVPVRYFPSIFGANADLPLDEKSVHEKFAALAEDVSRDTDKPVSGEDVADGFLTVAVGNMANALRKITIERGEDVRDFTLCCFGGAAGQHACRVAEVLGITKIWLHPMAGVLSAYGMGLADIRGERQRTVEVELSAINESQWLQIADALLDECGELLDQQQVPEERRQCDRNLGVRVDGSDTIISVALDNIQNMRLAFSESYRRRFGTGIDDAVLIVATVSIALTGRELEVEEPAIERSENATPDGTSAFWNNGEWLDIPVYVRGQLGYGMRIDGPAILAEQNGTTVIEQGWHGTLDELGHLLLESAGPLAVQRQADSSAPDPVRLEVFNQLFMHIAEQMGSVLQSTALSVNIRERLDFSCALFDAKGRLVSNAPHMPVHLGSMGESVRSVMENVGDSLQPGDAVMLNSPYNGGTHLPDITVVTPWFGDAEAKQPLFFFASRAHHADIGGLTPGSMPSTSQHIDEEGVLIDNVHLVRGGSFQYNATIELLANSRYPARNPRQNVADLKAQLAANQQGIRQMRATIARYGLTTVQNYLRFVRDNAAQSVRRLIGTLEDGAFSYEFDSGEIIRVQISLNRKSQTASIDFSGTSPESKSNFNAPSAVARAAVLYVFRALIDEVIPMNEGCLEPLEIIIPPGTMLSPVWPAAVVAGNVETSQCVTDALFGALDRLAASQGTMNNLTFGNEKVQYYETICGGAGAGDGFNGADAVHTHMTNSRLTDAEVLEQKFPVVLEAFSIRRGSGGDGKWHGGDGVLRRLKFTDAVEASVLSNHRRVAPFGIRGGQPAATGINRVYRKDGSSEMLGGTATVKLQDGDVLQIETPGGGGYGVPRGKTR